jgi:hypothetical protein
VPTSPHTTTTHSPPTTPRLHHPKPQALLEGTSLSQPQPKIPPELIKFLGRTYNAWHIATPLLELHVLIFPDETRCFALVEVYKWLALGACRAGRGAAGRGCRRLLLAICCPRRAEAGVLS